jgi:GNAT superfamily N-acetyltransferase
MTNGLIIRQAREADLPALIALSTISASMATRPIRRRPARAGIGARMIEFAIAEAKSRGMRLVRLTSNVKRKDAHRFYERLGFKPSHLGFKMALK